MAGVNGVSVDVASPGDKTHSTWLSSDSCTCEWERGGTVGSRVSLLCIPLQVDRPRPILKIFKNSLRNSFSFSIIVNCLEGVLRGKGAAETQLKALIHSVGVKNKNSASLHPVCTAGGQISISCTYGGPCRSRNTAKGGILHPSAQHSHQVRGHTAKFRVTAICCGCRTLLFSVPLVLNLSNVEFLEHYFALF